MAIIEATVCLSERMFCFIDLIPFAGWNLAYFHDVSKS